MSISQTPDNGFPQTLAAGGGEGQPAGWDSSVDPTIPPTLREAIGLHPSVVYIRGTRAGEVAHAAYEDIAQNHPNKTMGTVIWSVGTVATQIADRARIVIALAPPRAIEVMKDTQFEWYSSPAASATVVGMFAVWNTGMGKMLNKGMSRFVGATRAFAEQFPAAVRAVNNLLPDAANWSPRSQIESEVDESGSIKKKSLKKRVLSHLNVGATGAGIGSTPFVGTAAVNGLSERERNKVNNRVTVDSSVVLFPVLWGVTEAIRQAVIRGDIAQAEAIQDWAGKPAVWYGVAGGLVLNQFRSNRSARREAEAQLAEEESQTLEIVPDEA